MVPVAEWSWPTVTSVSVTASLVVFTWAVDIDWPKAKAGAASAGAAASPSSSLRRRWEIASPLLDGLAASAASCWSSKGMGHSPWRLVVGGVGLFRRDHVALAWGRS